MIVRTDKGNYNLVTSDSGKRIRVKGRGETYSEATELKSEPLEFEEA